MKRALLVALLTCGCMTSAQQEQSKRLDSEIEMVRQKLHQNETAQKVVAINRTRVVQLSVEVEALRSQVGRLESSHAKTAKSPKPSP